ncbi:MAG: hypothetical protein H6569_10505 [Lewinellaceae bacterium]|nr:hypothetical protein [Lewinellaceae bacterium]
MQETELAAALDRLRQKCRKNRAQPAVAQDGVCGPAPITAKPCGIKKKKNWLATTSEGVVYPQTDIIRAEAADSACYFRQTIKTGGLRKEPQ